MLVPAWQLVSRGLLIFLMREHDQTFRYDQPLADHEHLLNLIISGDHDAIQAELSSHIMSTIKILRRGRGPVGRKKLPLPTPKPR